MKKFLFAGLLLLAACSSNPEQVVFQARSAYVAGPLNGMAEYADLDRCEAPNHAAVCSKQDVVDTLRKADKTAESALDAAEDTVRKHKEVDPSFAIDAAKNAIAAVEEILTTYGIAWKEGQ